MDKIFIAWVKRFEELEAHLNALDAATGDGDHGTTMLRGLRAAAAEQSLPAKAFRKAAGGASGSLFSILIGALDKVGRSDVMLADALGEAASRISQIGQAVAGDKTMLDALIPASLEKDIDAALAAARLGCEETKAMVAKRGRAKYVEGAGVGYIDAGATSVVELLQIVAPIFSNRDSSSGRESSGTSS